LISPGRRVGHDTLGGIVEFRILGSIDVRAGERTLVVKGPKTRTLLALLACTPARPVSTEQIVDALWAMAPPAGTKAAIHTCVSALRRTLSTVGRKVLVRCPGGYLLDVPPESVDLWLFEHRANRGRAALREGDSATAAELLGDALALWRGVALSGAAGEWADRERARLTELRLAVTEDRLAAELALGRGQAVVAELSTLVAAHPLWERLRGQLMIALCQAGRHADAVECFREGRQLLVDELGIEPGADLSELFGKILRGEIGPIPGPEPVPAPYPAIPSQLPADLGDFTGRAQETREACDYLVSHRSGRTTQTIYAIAGKAGVGKSALATVVAHRVGRHFTDGQLYVNLRGAEPVPVSPAEVLGRFLRALGVADHAIPDDSDERAAYFRTVTAHLSVLILLDNAADERQVRLLLPASPDGAVIITSRRRLSALESAGHAVLDVLDPPTALELLARVTGERRVSAEPSAAREIARLVGFLPLALRIAGARMAGRPDRTMAYLSARLREQHRLLNELAVGDLEVRGSLVVSYLQLDTRERVALRRLAWLGIPDFATWVLAPLLAVSVDEAADIVETLVEAQLLDLVRTEGQAETRYRLHELTSAFARERAEAEEVQGEVLAAAERLAASWYVLVETAAGKMPIFGGAWTRGTESLSGGPLDEPVVAALLVDPAHWFDVEQPALVHMVERASELGLVAAATRLAAALCSSAYAVHNRFRQWWRTHSVALAAARRTGDKESQAILLAGLGDLRYVQDRLDEAVAYYRKALHAYDVAGVSTRNRAATQLSLGTVLCEQGRLAASLNEVGDVQVLVDPLMVARANHTRAQALTELADLDGALAAGTQALSVFQRIDHPLGTVMTHRVLGIVHRAAGRLDKAAAHCELALAEVQDFDAPLMHVYVHQALAKVRIRQGRGGGTRERLRDGLGVCERMQDGFGQALILRTLGELELAEGNFRDAEAYLDRSLRRWEALDLPLWRARCQRDRASVLEALGRHAAADETWAEARAVFHSYGSREDHEPRPRPITG
jgi:DNA-binding SARP family transcriptional activator